MRPDMTPDRAEKLRRLNRLEEVIRKADLQAAGLFELGEETGKGQNRCRHSLRQGAKALDEIEAVHVRQEQILQDQLRQMLGHQLDGGPAIPGFENRIVLARESNPEHFSRDGVVFDNQNGGRLHARGPPAR